MSKEEYGTGYKGWSKAIQELGSSPSTANKAAEEGELPDLPKEDLFYDCIDYYTPNQMQAYARQAIAADRASRQVANQDRMIGMATWISQNPSRLPDHACRDCVGDSDMVISGFRCGYHDALAFLNSHDARQVANKAEVEQPFAFAVRKPEDGHVFGIYTDINDARSTAQQWSGVVVPLWTSATPPATTGGASATPTGASTAPANSNPVTDRELSEMRKLVSHGGVYGAEFVDGEQLMACFWSVIGQINKQLESKQVSASTVLTDERIDLDSIEQYRMQMAAIASAAIGYWVESTGIKPEYDTPVLREVAKLYAKYEALHVAAQAGQVAVPVISSYDIDKVKAAKTKFVDALIHSGVQYRTCGSISATLNRIIDESEAAAAPSPAKESK